MPAAVDAAARLLARREHARRELGQKLLQRGFSADIVDQALEELIRRRWLDEARYAATIARHRAAQGRGPRWVAAELAAQGIEGEACREALEQEELDWEEACLRALQRLPEKDPEPKLRQKLYQRGFDPGQISYALGARISAAS